MRIHAISGVSFFSVSSQGTRTGLDTLRERKRDCELTTVEKTYSPGNLGLQLNADTPVIPMYSMYSLNLSMSDNSSVFSTRTRGFLTVYQKRNLSINVT